MTSWTVPRQVFDINIPRNPPWRDLGPNQQLADLAFRQNRLYPQQNQQQRWTVAPGFAAYVNADTLDSLLPMQLVRALEGISILRRWADKRQTHLYERPLPDGSNLNRNFTHPDAVEVVARPVGHVGAQSVGDQDLVAMYNHYRHVVEMLHSDHLISIDRSVMRLNPRIVFNFQRYQALNNAIQHGLNGLEMLENQKLGNPEAELLEGFQWLERCEEEVWDALAGMSAAWLWSQEQNINVRHALNLAWTSLPEMTRLVIMLLGRSSILNTRMFQEHIFSELMDKRIHLLTVDDMTALGVQGTRQVYDQYYHDLCDDLQDYQEKISRLFNYQQLVKWGYGDIWKKLFLVIDTDNSGISLRTVQEFRLWAEHNGKLAHDSFAIHPIPLNDIPIDDTCSICAVAFGEDDHPTSMRDARVFTPHIVAELHCGHRFHPSCILKWLDFEYKYQNACAFCRQQQGSLRDQVVINAEYQDLDSDLNPGALNIHRDNLAHLRQAYGLDADPQLMRANPQHRYLVPFFWRDWVSRYMRTHRRDRFNQLGHRRWNIVE